MALQACHKGTKTKRTAHQKHRAFPVGQQVTRPLLLAKKELTATTTAAVLMRVRSSGFTPCLLSHTSYLFSKLEADYACHMLTDEGGDCGQSHITWAIMRRFSYCYLFSHE